MEGVDIPIKLPSKRPAFSVSHLWKSDKLRRAESSLPCLRWSPALSSKKTKLFEVLSKAIENADRNKVSPAQCWIDISCMEWDMMVTMLPTVTLEKGSFVQHQQQKALQFKKDNQPKKKMLPGTCHASSHLTGHLLTSDVWGAQIMHPRCPEQAAGRCKSLWVTHGTELGWRYPWYHPLGDNPGAQPDT